MQNSDFSSKGLSYVFSSANVDVVPTDEDTPEEALESMGLSFGGIAEKVSSGVL
jgi:hypothetical protein